MKHEIERVIVYEDDPNWPGHTYRSAMKSESVVIVFEADDIKGQIQFFGGSRIKLTLERTDTDLQKEGDQTTWSTEAIDTLQAAALMALFIGYGECGGEKLVTDHFYDIIGPILDVIPEGFRPIP